MKKRQFLNKKETEHEKEEKAFVLSRNIWSDTEKNSRKNAAYIWELVHTEHIFYEKCAQFILNNWKHFFWCQNDESVRFFSLWMFLTFVWAGWAVMPEAANPHIYFNSNPSFCIFCDKWDTLCQLLIRLNFKSHEHRWKKNNNSLNTCSQFCGLIHLKWGLFDCAKQPVAFCGSS